MIKLLAASALLISIAFATQAQSGYLLRPTGEKISFESMKAGEQYLLKYITFSHEEVAKTIPLNKIAQIRVMSFEFVADDHQKVRYQIKLKSGRVLEVDVAKQWKFQLASKAAKTDQLKKQIYLTGSSDAQLIDRIVFTEERWP